MSILPSTTYEIEREMDDAISSLLKFDTPLADLWDADKCPEPLLIYLAWALSVDYWNEDWSEQVKRSVVSSSLDIHRLKGTTKSLVDAINTLGYVLDVEFWHENKSIEKGKFRVNISASGLEVTGDLYSELVSIINENKRGTLHLDAFNVESSSKVKPLAVAYTKLGEKMYSFPR